MGYVYDAFKGDLFHEHALRQVAADPASAKEGALIINTSSSEIKVYYGGTWQVIATLNPASLSYFLQEDGTSRFLQEDGTSLLAIE
jgi:hypothetical protein